MKRLLYIGVLFIFLVTLPVSAEQDTPETDMDERVAELESRIEELEGRIEILEEQQNTEEYTEESSEEPNSQIIKRERPGRDRAAEKEALRRKRVEELIQDSWDKIAAIEAKMSSQRANDNQISFLKKRARLLAGKERELSKIKNLAKRNPDIDIDTVAVEEEIINCRAAKKSCYDQVEDLRKAERERKKYE